MIPVFNCSQYLTETLESVLKQGIAPEDMQIEVIDDASTDADVEALVLAIGKGRVKYYRQEQNVGSLCNFVTCINRAQGRIVHILHGDDRVVDGYYQKLDELFYKYPEAGAAFSGFAYIDERGQKMYDQRPEMKEDGILKDWLLKISEYQRVQYAAIAVRREVYEALGGFYGVTYGEDWEMWVRIARYYPIAYTPEVLADYRKHGSSISGQKFITGQYLKDLLRVMEYIQGYLPEDEREKLLKKTKKFYAHYGIRVANQVWHSSHNKSGVQQQVRQTLSLHSDLLLYLKIAKIYVKMFLNRK
ncbi:glycosyltransferase [Pontibacter diazotrophicus]|uniref:Glycosyltransferase n=2 Tax=Pontibacter diazotrophicus TaxID=1400979 RepID=A0A3D8LH33_9BACT|nr:glycosyltransferase [Pontibacter diazotrophicus]